VPEEFLKPTPESSSQVRERFIVNKYKFRTFVSASGKPRKQPVVDTTSAEEKQERCAPGSAAVEFIGILCVNLLSAR
jgi:hypothetical protein